MADLRTELEQLEDNRLDYVIARSQSRSDAEGYRKAGIAKGVFYRWPEEERIRMNDLAQKIKRPGMSQIFLDFAAEEKGHKAKLLAVKKGKQFAPSARKVADLNISDYLVDVEPSADLDYQGALIVAMKKEKAAFMLYNQLSTLAPDAALRDLLTSLAQEEAKHKLRFEIEYDQVVLTDN